MGWLPISIKWNSIHTKLLATYLSLTAVGTTVLASYILFSFHAYFIRTRQADLEDWTAALSESVADALEQNELQKVDLLVQRYGAPDNITLRIFGPKANLLFSSDSQDRQITDWFNVPGIKEALQNQSTQGVGRGVLSNDDRVYAARPIFRNGRLLGILRMSVTLEQFQRQFRTLIWTVFGTLILTFVLCALISEWFTRTIATPIKAMRNFAIRLGGGHLGDKLNIRQSDELGQLATELNRMSERLASLDNERRAFLANVSHELRTPVSNVMVTLDALANGADEEPELRDRFIQIAQDETKRLSQLIKDLLDLGRLEAGVTSLEPQPLKLRDLIDRAVRAIELRMRADGIDICIDIPDIQIHSDPERLLQALLNVLDNAIKHSLPNSRVFILGRKESKQVVLEIQDRGTGISQSDLPHIFEQFYTADRSRKGSGTGLGLAIARRIVEAHGGNITASSQGVGKGATFTISLPLDTPSLVPKV